FVSLFCWWVAHRYLLSFPTRRSSDLGGARADGRLDVAECVDGAVVGSSGRRFSALLLGLHRRTQPHVGQPLARRPRRAYYGSIRSEEHTSELQSRLHLVCRLLREYKK